jgi:hypothetical protein
VIVMFEVQAAVSRGLIPVSAEDSGSRQLVPGAVAAENRYWEQCSRTGTGSSGSRELVPSSVRGLVQVAVVSVAAAENWYR